MTDKEEKLISLTRSMCPKCEVVIDARIFERGGSVIQSKTCQDHGDFESVIHDDPEFFRRCMDGTSEVPDEFVACDITGCRDCLRHMDYIKTLMIDVTERCNLNCTACFTNTHTRDSRDPTLEEITSRLAGWKSRPAVLLCGGEPTMRKDLPELINAITSMGFVVKMASNGINLTDADYVRRLREAGLGWVLFQFDGFSDEIYLKTRKKALMGVKEDALKTLSEAGIKVCLACMVVKGINDGEVGKILEYAMKNDFIMHVGCTVLSCVGRDGFPAENSTSAKDVIRAFEKETAGTVTEKDFMQARSLGVLAYRLTGNGNFQQKSCFHTLMIHNRGGRPFPANRYFNPLTALMNLKGFLQLALLFGRLRNWDAMALSGRVKLLTIEEFREHDTIDLTDANRCNKVYMAENGYIPPCIYNTKYRGEMWQLPGKEMG